MQDLNQLNRQVAYKYELLDKNNNHKKWLCTVSSCNIAYQSLTQLKASARLSMLNDDDINWLTDRLRIYMVLNGVQTLLGTFLLSSSGKKIDKMGAVSREVEAYSTLQILLDDKLETRLQIVTGTNAVNECIRLIGTNGLYDITPSTKTLLSDKVYEIGASKLEVINDLLNIVNYTNLYVDREGKYIARPYVLPTDREIDITIQNDITGLVREEMTDSLDLFSVPNVWIRYTNDIEINPPLSYVFENTNASSITSIQNRGRRIVDAQSMEATSLDDLVVKCKADALEANSKYATLEFAMAINPSLEFYMPCAFIKTNHVNDKYIIYNIQFDCKLGADMKIKARKVVNVL